jgi:hypothetical protein
VPDDKPYSSRMTMPFAATPGPYTTQLDPVSEVLFHQWLRQAQMSFMHPQGIPFNPNQQNPDYDMRGFFHSMLTGDPSAKTATGSEGLPHYPDTYKTPLHSSFSNESKYATPDAPYWVGDELKYRR